MTTHDAGGSFATTRPQLQNLEESRKSPRAQLLSVNNVGGVFSQLSADSSCADAAEATVDVRVLKTLADSNFEELYIYATPSASKRSIMSSPLVLGNILSVQRALPHHLSKRIRPPFPTYLPLSTPKFITSQTEKFSKDEHQAPRTNNVSPEIPTNPSFSLEDLGANRTVRVVVMASLSIIATMESLFWIKVAWAKFGPSKEDGNGMNGSDAA